MHISAADNASLYVIQIDAHHTSAIHVPARSHILNVIKLLFNVVLFWDQWQCNTGLHILVLSLKSRIYIWRLSERKIALLYNPF